MKQGIHPEYRLVVFHDTTADKYFTIRSTLVTDRTIEFEGHTYPYMAIDISSESHPFYTGKQRNVESVGQVAKFNKRYKRSERNESS